MQNRVKKLYQNTNKHKSLNTRHGQRRREETGENKKGSVQEKGKKGV